MLIREVYKRYEIMPTLQLHMLRVAAVAQILVELLRESIPLDEYPILTACLLHDLGNITKFNFHHFPHFFEPEGVDYWQKVQQRVKEDYGQSPREATAAMCRELGISKQVIELIAAIDFSNAAKNYRSQDWARQICAYADMRVAPHGVVKLTERLDEARNRYRTPGNGSLNYDIMQSYLEAIEEQIAGAIAIPVDDITNEMAEERLETLKDWNIKSPKSDEQEVGLGSL